MDREISLDYSDSTTMTKRAKAEPSSSIGELIDIDLIRLPLNGQPRRYFNNEKLKQLTASIEAYGILEPLIIRALDDGTYELVAGERRLRAAKEADLTKVPVIVKEFTDDQAFEIALLENLQRDDLNPIEETEGILRLLQQNLSCSKEEVIKVLNQAANAKRRNQVLQTETTRQLEIIDKIFLTIGRLNRESFRTNRLPLLNLPEDVLKVLRQGELTYTKAKEIAKLEENQRQKLMEETIDKELSLREIKKRVQEIKPRIQEDQHEAGQNILAQKLMEMANLAKSTASSNWEDNSKKEEIEVLISKIERILGGQ